MSVHHKRWPPQTLITSVNRKPSKSWTLSVQKPLFFLFSSKALFLFFSSAGLGVWFMELREKCHEVGMLKEAGLLPRRCKMHGSGAWDSVAPSSIIADACCACTKAKTDKKIKMAVKLWERRKRGRLTTLEESVGIFFFFFYDQTSISASAATNFGTLMRHAESGWTRTMKYDDAGWKGC